MSDSGNTCGNAHKYGNSSKKNFKEDTIEDSNINKESDSMIDDSFLIEVPEIPLPDDSNKASEVQDEFYVDEGNAGVAFKFAFVGLGQGGGRIAESFWKLGYRRVCCINTTGQDLKGIDIPDENKLVIGDNEGGAGKNPENGKRMAEGAYEDIYDVMRRSFGDGFDRIFVCVGAGGGSGSGSCNTVINIAHEMAKSLKKEDKDVTDTIVGVIASMPKHQEGGKVSANAHNVLSSLFEQVGQAGKLGNRKISPLVIVDNDKINKIYPNLPVGRFWDVANKSISSLFHLFNSIAVKDSEFATFDRADFKDLLQSGIVSFGACPIANWKNNTGISYAIRDNLKNNVLVGGFDMSQSSAAGCIFIASNNVLNEIPQDNLEHGFEMLTRIMQDSAVVHRGIYAGSKDGLVVYTLMGELNPPNDRMEEIASIAGIN